MITWTRLGYFQTRIWFWLYPCVDTSSLACFDQARLHTWVGDWMDARWGCSKNSTWLPVSTDCMGWPVKVFQNLKSTVNFKDLKYNTFMSTCCKPDISVSSAPSTCQKPVVMRRPCNGFHSGKVLSVPLEQVQDANISFLNFTKYFIIQVFSRLHGSVCRPAPHKQLVVVAATAEKRLTLSILKRSADICNPKLRFHNCHV